MKTSTQAQTGPDAMNARFAADMAAQLRAASDFLTDRLRIALRRMVAMARTQDGDAVADALQPWAEMVRIDNLAEWYTKAGWAVLDADRDRADELEAALVEFFSTHGRASATDRGAPSLRWTGYYAEKGWGKLDLGCPRGALESVDAKGLDALKTVLADRHWIALAPFRTPRSTLEGPTRSQWEWLTLLAAPWFEAQAEREAAKAAALPLALQPRNVITAKSTGAAFLRFPSLLKDAGAWCGGLVPVDGDTIFAEEPALAAAPLRMLKDTGGADVQLYKPRAWTVAAGRRLAGPSQLVLPGITLDAQQNPDLGAFLAVTATGAAVVDRLPGVCAKLLPLLFALCPLDGTPVQGFVKDLVKLLYPDWRTRRQMTGDMIRVGAAVAALRGLRIVEALPGGALRFFPVMDGGFYDIPTGPGQDPETCLRLNPELSTLSTPEPGKGAFVLLNLSRLMDLDAKSPDRIAVALRLAAYWHTCKQRVAGGRRVFMPERLDFLPVDDLLVTINVPGRAPDVIAGEDTSPAGRRKLSDERARLVDVTLPALVEAGLVGQLATRRGVQRAGGAWMVKAEPPADYLEASRQTGRTSRPPRKTPRK